MDATRKNSGSNFLYEKSSQPFNSSEKSQISILTTETVKGEIIFRRKDIDTQDFIKNKSKYKIDRDLTIAHLEKKLSKSNKFNSKQIKIFLKNIQSDIAVMDNYSPRKIAISKKATEASADYEEFLDFIIVCKHFKTANTKYSELPLNIREKNEGISSDDLKYTPDQEKIINNFNKTKFRYDSILNIFNSEFDKEIWKDDDALNKEKKIRFDLFNSAEKDNNEMQLASHASSEKINYLKASLFEENLKIFKININISEEALSPSKSLDKPELHSYKWQKTSASTLRSDINYLKRKEIKLPTNSTETTNLDQPIQNSANSSRSNSTQSISSTSNTASIGSSSDIAIEGPNNNTKTNPQDTAATNTRPRYLNRGLLSDIEKFKKQNN